MAEAIVVVVLAIEIADVAQGRVLESGRVWWKECVNMCMGMLTKLLLIENLTCIQVTMNP